MHSVWSDGAETIESIAEACLARGHRCAGITDHSYGLPVAGGMTMAPVVDQHAEIDGLNRKLEGRFRLFKGIETNIRPDGTVDMEPDELRRFEFVVASPHSQLCKSVGQTGRMAGAVSQPGRL
jgi:histidinol phosphatase-like PHP family hydrolase